MLDVNVAHLVKAIQVLGKGLEVNNTDREQGYIEMHMDSVLDIMREPVEKHLYSMGLSEAYVAALLNDQGSCNILILETIESILLDVFPRA